MPRLKVENWTQQPQFPVGIDYGNPIAKDLGFLMYGPWILPVAPDTTITRQGFLPTGGINGASARYNGSNVSLKLSQAITGSSPSECTFFVLGQITTTASDLTLLAQTHSTDNPLMRLYSVTSGTWAFHIRDDSTASLVLTASTPVVNKDAFLVGVYRSGTAEKSIWQNGVKKNTGTTAGGAITLSRTTVGQLWRSAEVQYHSGQIALAGIINRALTDAEVVEFSKNPWQILAPKKRAFFLDIGVAGLDLSPSFFTNTNTFYSPSVSTGEVTLSPSLFSDSNSFYSPSVTTGSVTLSPSLFSNSNSFYSHVLTLDGGTQSLLPSLLSNSESFYSPTVTTGTVTLLPSLFTSSTNTFYNATVSQGAIELLPSLFSNTSSFYSAVVTPGTISLTPSLYTNPQTFFTPTVTQPSVQTLIPDFYLNSQTFYSHVISSGTTLSPTDLLAIADAVWAHPEALTVAKFLGLK